MSLDYPPSVLLVGPYAPRRCGLATHLSQFRLALAASGRTVSVLSPPDGDGDFKADLRGGFRILQLLAFAKRFDRVNLHFEFSEYFHLGRGLSRFANFITLFAFAILFLRMRNLAVVMHERPPSRFAVQRTFIQRWAWSLVPHIVFFTRRELETFEQTYRLKFRPGQAEIEDVTLGYQRHCHLDQAAARASLDIPAQGKIFLCVGFINPNKGFDRAISAFQIARPADARLYIVGSVRLDDDLLSKGYMARLKAQSSVGQHTYIVDQYLSDEGLDRWLVACDYLVIPYRFISNSGILGRARMYGRRAIVSDIGGLAEQIGPDDFLFGSDDELLALVRRVGTNETTAAVSSA